jgi:hypothetical protein
MTPARRRRGRAAGAAIGDRVEGVVARLDELVARLQRVERLLQAKRQGQPTSSAGAEEEEQQPTPQRKDRL